MTDRNSQDPWEQLNRNRNSMRWNLIVVLIFLILFAAMSRRTSQNTDTVSTEMISETEITSSKEAASERAKTAAGETITERAETVSSEMPQEKTDISSAKMAFTEKNNEN